MNNIIQHVVDNPVTRVLGAKIDTVGDIATDNDLKGNITFILNSIIAALGVVAVIVIIIGGINYMTSSGDTSKVDKAKKTILYGLIGMIICVLAFAIVNFVITQIISDTPAPSSGE